MMRHLVINFGHPLSSETIHRMNQQYSWVPHTVECPIHINPIEQTYEECVAIVEELEKKHKLSSNCNVMIMLPGLTAAAVYLITLIAGVTGRLPMICHVVYDKGRGVYVPNAKHGFVDLNDVKADGRSIRIKNVVPVATKG